MRGAGLVDIRLWQATIANGRLLLASKVEHRGSMVIRQFAALLTVFLLSACASTYQNQIVTAPTSKLIRGKAVVIATPRNGAYDRKEYQSSGRQTALAVQAAFARYSDSVVVSSRCTSVTCLEAEGVGDYEYLVVPEILHWEDRNTEWSGIPDRVEIKLVISNARSKVQLASIVILGKSKWATFGGDHPQDLLPHPIKQFVDSLY
jgi:hypothetical protein